MLPFLADEMDAGGVSSPPLVHQQGQSTKDLLRGIYNKHLSAEPN